MGRGLLQKGKPKNGTLPTLKDKWKSSVPSNSGSAHLRCEGSKANKLLDHLMGKDYIYCTAISNVRDKTHGMNCGFYTLYEFQQFVILVLKAGSKDNCDMLKW